ncbi:MAG: blaR1 peptidase M56 [Cytophagaceae bacterium]|nr:blaR1 peptidase M56 [Cytophagaceae bacterium]
MVLYIFQVILFQAVFLMAYRIWLHRETHFNLNRVYLLLTPALAMLLPFVDFDVFDAATQPVNRYIHELPEVFLGAGEAAATQVEELPTITLNAGRDLFKPEMFLPLAYILGMLGSVLLFARKYNSITRYFRFKRKDDKSIIHIPNSTTAFTFFNTIFLGEKIDALSRKQILKHEQVHVSQKHGLDLLFFEFLKVAMWFNPVIYAYQKTIAELHEFIADEKAAKTYKTDYLNQLLNTAFGTQQVSFINTFFNHSLTKKRIIMLRSNSKKISKLKYLLILPLLGVMLFVASCTQDDKMNDASSKTLDEQIADLKLVLENSDEITQEQKQQLGDLFNEATNKKLKDVPAPPPPPKKTGEEVVSVEEVSMLDETIIEDVPYSVVETVPAYPGCEGLDNATAKKCMSMKITQMVNREFNTNLGKELGLKGVNRIYVRFKIDANGDIVDIGARGPHPALEAEAKRVINMLPAMTPGKQRGKNVGVLYSLPIVFQVAE